MQTKACNTCNQELELSPVYFQRRKSKPDGFDCRCKSCTNAYLRRWKKDHPDKVRVHAQTQRDMHPEKARQLIQSWRTRNAERSRQHSATRYRRETSLPNNFTDADWDRALVFFNHQCCICGTSKRLLVPEHWIPLNMDTCPGTVPTNILPMCHGKRGCNNRKGRKHPQQWLLEAHGDEAANLILAHINEYFKSL